MRALTLTQPWCGLVASGLKRVENRPRHLIKREDFGVPFALHASREVRTSVYERIDQLWPRCGVYLGDRDATCLVRTCSRRVGHAGPCDHVAGEHDDLAWMRLSRITSAVIGIVTIDRVIDPLAHGIPLHDPDAFGAEPPDQRRWCFGPIVYVLRDVRPLATPVLCRGWQGFWTLPPDIECQVTMQIARAA